MLKYLAIIILLIANSAIACSWDKDPDSKERYLKPDTIFIGTVQGIDNSNWKLREVTIKVKESFRGKLKVGNDYLFALQASSCSATLKEGESYLIAMYENPPEKRKPHLVKYESVLRQGMVWDMNHNKQELESTINELRAANKSLKVAP